MTNVALASPRRTSPRYSLAAQARQTYAERIRRGTIDEASTWGGHGIPLDVLARMRSRSAANDDWCEVTDYFALRVEGRLTYASIARGGPGETIEVFNDLGDPLAKGFYPVDEDGSPCGDVLWR